MSKLKKRNELCLEKYIFKGKEYFIVTVQRRDKNSKMIKRKSRFTATGNRIASLKSAEKVKTWLRRELDEAVDSVTSYTWKSWFSKALDEMRKSGLKESTVLSYEGPLKVWCNPSWWERELSTFTRKDVFDYVHEYLVQREASDWTRRNVWKRTHRIFEMAMDDGILVRNPARGIKVEVESDESLALTPREVQLLLQKAKELNHEFYPHWVLALMTGMRNGELYALGWSHIDFEAGVIRVLKQFTSKDGYHPPKRGKTRPIDLSPGLKKFLLEVKSKYGISRQKFWSWQKDRWLIDELVRGKKTGQKVYKVMKVKSHFEVDDLVLPRVSAWSMGMQASVLKAFCRKIGVREVGFHDLRATHITNLLSNGATISQVMKQVGHSKMSTTDGYHRLTGVAVKGVTKHLSYRVPDGSETENVIQLFDQPSK